jgi:hypothetical protein
VQPQLLHWHTNTTASTATTTPPPLSTVLPPHNLSPTHRCWPYAMCDIQSVSLCSPPLCFPSPLVIALRVFLCVPSRCIKGLSVVAACATDVQRIGSDLRQERGEVLIDHLGEIEDTKGNNGQKGKLFTMQPATILSPSTSHINFNDRVGVDEIATAARETCSKYGMPVVTPHCSLRAVTCCSKRRLCQSLSFLPANPVSASLHTLFGMMLLSLIPLPISLT